MTLKAFTKGLTSASSQFNYNVPTNPKLTTESTHSTEGDRLFTIIYPDDSTVETITEYGGLVNTSYNNLETTSGYKIKCYDSASQEGVLFNVSDLSTYNYFVLIHSDNHLLHHFAKITEKLNMDEDGDGFEFYPKLGNEVAEGTKFMIFKGPEKTSPAIAISAGIKKDLQNKLMVSRPLFYFFKDKLDKVNELDHNTKYYIRQLAEHNSATLNFSTMSHDKATILVSQDYDAAIVDYSKYSMQLTFQDNLRDLDNPANSPYKSNEGVTITLDYSDYDDAFPNARRDTDDLVIAGQYFQKGPIRYGHYGFSPDRTNILYNVLEGNFHEDISGSTGLAEITLTDSFRIMPKKIQEFDSIRVRHAVHTGNLNSWFALGAKVVSNQGNNDYVFRTEFDLRDLLAANDEIKIGNEHLLIHNISTFSSVSNQQTLNCKTITRGEKDGAFVVNTHSATVGDLLYRRAFKPSATHNGTKNTLLTDFNLMKDRHDRLHINFITGGFSNLFAEVISVSGEKKLMVLSIDVDSYYDDPLQYCEGQYSIQVERINGEIETIESYKGKDGQTYMKLEGRDKFNKLLSPIVSKNFLFSEDIIYSSMSPYNKLTDLSATITVDFNSEIGSSPNNKSGITFNTAVTLSDGDYIYAKHTNGTFVYVGEIYIQNGASASSTTFYLREYPKTKGTNLAAFKSTTTNYIFNKALSSNLYLNSTTSLNGASDKGVIFNAGRAITRNPTTTLPSQSITLGDVLAGTSASGNPKDLGYDISNCKGIESDNAFQGTLDNESFKTVNTLIDFTIASVQESGRNKIVKVAPYMPISLGRVQINYANTQDISFTEKGSVLTTSNESYIDTTNAEYLSGSINKRTFHGKPLYFGANKTFAGIISSVELQTDYTTVRIYLDRKVSCSSGDKLYVLSYSATYNESSKLTHELHLLNGGHLHGGKFISLLDSLRDISGSTQLFDYPLYYNTMGSNPETHSARFGPSLYRLLNIEKGNVNINKKLYTTTAQNAPETYRFYSDKTSKIKYYASAYKMNFGYFLDSGTLDNNIIGTNLMFGSNHLLPETRGLTSPSGSNFFDADVLAANESLVEYRFNSPLSTNSGYWAKDNLNQIDPKAVRMFLFANSDLLPYSSVRYDSLMKGDKTITNYSLLALKEPITAGRSDEKDLILGKTESLNLVDSDYVSASIISADKDISTLKRFSMMRLTELVLDAHFNIIDAENLPSRDKEIPTFTYTSYPRTDFTGSLAVDSITATKIIYDGTITASPSPTGNIFDAEGRFIGVVSALGVSTTNASNDTLNLVSITKTNVSAIGGLPHYYSNNFEDNIQGIGKEDTSLLKGNFNLLKGFVVNSVGSNGYGESSSTWHGYYSATLSNSWDSGKSPGIIYPLNIQHRRQAATDYATDAFPSYVLEYLSDVQIHTSSSAVDSASKLFDGMDAVILDRFSIEDGEQLASKGMTVELGGASISVQSTTGKELGLIGIKGESIFAEKESANGATFTGSDKATKADGIYYGFKPRITLSASTDYLTGTGNNLLFRHTIEATDANKFLDFVDLTGTYLHDNANEIAYVVSHEIDHTRNLNSGNRYHNLILDFNITGTLEILQPNHVCFYPFSPKEIKINELSPRYTKVSGENKCYDGINDYNFKNAQGSNQEGVMSMYVIVDLDGQSTTSAFRHIVLRDISDVPDILDEGKLEVIVSDGEKSYLNSLNFENKTNKILTFEKHEEIVGVASISETINLTVNGDITNEHKRTMIGADVQIGKEAQDIVNDLLEDENLEFSTDGTTSYFIAPNYTSIDLYSAIRFAASKINKSVFIDGDSYTLKDNQNSDLYVSSVKIGDNSNVKVFEFIKSQSVFNFYNEIIVYGNSHKSTRKNLKSIQKVGRKTLEHTDKALVNQTEVDEKARQLFKSYNSNNHRIEMLIHHENVSTLQVGDIVTVEIAQENIPLSNFLVVKIKHLLTGMINITLDRYSKLLEDTLSELALLATKNEADSRSNNLASGETSIYFLEDLKINIRKLLVRKRTSIGGTRLGFTTTLNTGSETLGFGANASVTLTDLLEEEF